MSVAVFSRSRDYVRRTVFIACLASLGACSSFGLKDDPPRPAQAQEPVTAERIGTANQTLVGGRVRDALEQYQQILAIDPKNIEARLGLGEAFLALNDPDRAREAFSVVAADTAFKAPALQGRGLAELAQNHIEEAAADLKDAVAADPTLWRAWNGLGFVHDLKREWEAGRQAYEKALSNAPKAGIVHNNIGFSLLVQKRYSAAAEEFRAALREVPNLETAQNNLRLALAFQGRYGDALAGVSKDNRAMLLNNVGYVAMLRHDYAAAEGYLSRALEESASYYGTAAQNLSRLKSLKGQPTGDSAPANSKSN